MAELADAADLPSARSGKTPAQLQIYGTQANTLIDNAGVIRIFGIRNYPMAQDLANAIGGISADELLRLPNKGL
jgi:hypothetical protein